MHVVSVLWIEQKGSSTRLALCLTGREEGDRDIVILIIRLDLSSTQSVLEPCAEYWIVAILHVSRF